MPPDLDSITGVHAAIPSAGVQTGSGQSGKGRYAPPQKGVAAVQAAVEQIRAILSGRTHTLEFRADPETGLVLVLLKDAQTGTVFRQIPGSAILRLADALLAPESAPQPLVDLTA